MNMRIGPPVAPPVLRPGGRHWPKPRPAFLSPYDVVDVDHGSARQLLEIQLELLHAGNFNDPGRWRARGV